MPPLEIEFTPRFRRAARSLSAEQRRQVAVATGLLSDVFGQPHLHSGLGIRRLGPDVFEYRAGRDLRVVFELTGSFARLVIVGNHDEVKRFIRNR